MPDQALESRPSARTKPRLDFQQHLADLEAQGLLIRIDRPINKDTELHPLVRWQFIGGMPEEQRKAFLFTNVVDGHGKKYAMPVVLGALAASAQIYAQGMGRKVDEIGTAWMEAINHPIPPLRVNAGACQEVVIKGDDLKKPGGGLASLPVPVSTPGFDSAPYLTATLCITRDPDSGIPNMGMYRAALKATDRLAVRMAAVTGGAGGYQHWLKYRARKEKMPIAIVLGAAPVVCFTSPQKLPIDLDELAVAGGLAGEPIKTVKAVTIDLDVPADAELVIEGLIDTSMAEPEAPFGESNGYLALEAFNMPMQVTAITRKKNAVFCAILSQVTPSESSLIKRVAYEPLYLSHLRDTLGVKGVKRVLLHEPLTNLRPVIMVQLARGTARTEVWRALHGASTFMAHAGKICIAVSEDIEPSNCDALFWSMGYRCNPIEDVLLVPYHGGQQGDRRSVDSAMLIDATQKRDMPPLALPKKEFMENARKIWEELGLPPVTLRAPWHGYSLGHWNEMWDLFAKRAAESDWEVNGKETLARSRSSIEPETPAWKVEKPAQK